MSLSGVALPPNDREAVLTQALAEVVRRLEISSKELAQIIGVSQPTASRLLRGEYQLHESNTKKEWELATHFVRLYRSLFSLVGGDDALAQRWLRSENDAFEAEPISLVTRVDGLLRVMEYLDAHRSRV